MTGILACLGAGRSRDSDNPRSIGSVSFYCTAAMDVFLDPEYKRKNLIQLNCLQWFTLYVGFWIVVYYLLRMKPKRKPSNNLEWGLWFQCFQTMKMMSTFLG